MRIGSACVVVGAEMRVACMRVASMRVASMRRCGRCGAMRPRRVSIGWRVRVDHILGRTGTMLAAMLRCTGGFVRRPRVTRATELRPAGSVGRFTYAVLATKLRSAGGIGVRSGVAISTTGRVTCRRACRSGRLGIAAACARSSGLGGIAARVHNGVGYGSLGARPGIRPLRNARCCERCGALVARSVDGSTRDVEVAARPLELLVRHAASRSLHRGRVVPSPPGSLLLRCCGQGVAAW